MNTAGTPQDLETDLVMVIGQLEWFANVLENDDDINPALVLRGMIAQLSALIDPIAQLEMAARRAERAA